MKCEDFGVLDGKKVKKYTLSNPFIEVEILTYGGAVRSIKVPDRDGNFVDVALGYNTIEEYSTNGGYLGAVIGRVGNRIENGTFKLKRKVINVGINDGNNSLHGGFVGFDKKIWEDHTYGEQLELSYISHDQEEGYPGNLQVTVKYFLIGSSLNIEYFAKSDKDTVVSLTNHTYFNLGGENSGDILNAELMIDSTYITPVDENLITHGDFYNIVNTPFDFRAFKRIGKDINIDDRILRNCGGYDVNYVLNGEGYRRVAQARDKKTGITMSVFTDREGMQFYSGNFLDNVKGKTINYDKRSGFCLETQSFPNAVNCKEYPSILLKKGNLYHTVTTYDFGKEQ